MGQSILDGTGTGRAVKVSTDNRLDVSSRSDERIFYASRDDEEAFIIHSFDSAAAVNEYQLYFKNDNTLKDFIVKEIILTPGVAMTFKISTVTGTAGGTTVTPLNLNLKSGKLATATVFGDAAVTGLTEATNFLTVAVAALTTKTIDFHDALILSEGDTIAVECDVNAGGLVYMMLIGHFE